MLIRYFIYTCIAIALTNCAQQPAKELSDQDRKEIISQVTKTLNEYYAAVNKTGLSAEFDYLDNSKEFNWTPPGYTSPLTFAQVEEGVKQNAKLFSLIDNRWSSVSVFPLTTHLASYTGVINSTVKDTTGNSSTYNLIETGILIKRNNGWKLLSGQTSILPTQK